MAKVPRTPQEIEQQICRQVRRLKKACNRFDDGDEDEAQQIATILRLLLHHKNSNKALLHQTGALSRLRFVQTALPRRENDITSFSGLVSIAFGGATPPRYHAVLDSCGFSEPLAFGDWWTTPILIRQDGICHTRADIVLTIAEQDGGAHFDPSLEQKHYEITRENAMSTFGYDNGELCALNGVDIHSLRQIAHELLRTLDPSYRKTAYIHGGHSIRHINLTIIPEEQFDVSSLNLLETDPCYCRSGKTFGECHGAIKT